MADKERDWIAVYSYVSMQLIGCTRSEAKAAHMLDLGTTYAKAPDKTDAVRFAYEAAVKARRTCHVFR